MTDKEYWRECIETAIDECELTATAEQVAYLSDAVSGAHECYGMAFYSPPPSDRVSSVEREWKAKYEALQREFDKYRANAEGAVKRALRQPSDANVSIENDGSVSRIDGRTTLIQY